MSIFDRELLFGTIRPALRPLWEAYARIQNDSRTWVQETLAEVTDPLVRPLTEKMLTKIAAEQLHAVAGCLVMLADNFVKAYVVEAGLDEHDRVKFGGEVSNGIPYGAALLAGGNAFRHYATWNGHKPFHETDAILTALGISERDESVCLRILELDGARSLNGFESRLDVFCEQVEKATGH